jgi:hypothetical protein
VLSLKNTIRYNSDGPIAPQLGQFSQKGHGKRRNAVFFGTFPCICIGSACRKPTGRQLATGNAMRETIPRLNAGVRR